MGLFVTDDGHYQGWLAALLCCCAALSEDEHPFEKHSISRPTTISRNTVCNEQPTPLRPLPSTTPRALAAASDNKGIDAAFDHHDLVRPISDRPPSIKPLDFGRHSPLLGKMSLHARQKSSTALPKGISIGRPTDFRRLDYTEKQRRSLVPLQLSPVVLREHAPGSSTYNAAGTRVSRSADGLIEDSTDIEHSYTLSHGIPLEPYQQLSAGTRDSDPSAGSVVSERGQIILDPKIQTPIRPTLSTQSSASSLQSFRRQALESASSTSITSRPSSEKIRLKRKRSSQKSSGGSADLNIDKEILELNTIIEERRAESARPQSPVNDDHRSALAPSMLVRARAETLNDIGSAFSRPLVSRTVSEPPLAAVPAPMEKALSPATPIKSRLSRPFVSMPDPSVMDQANKGHIRRPSSRITGWLSNLLSSSSAPAPATNSPHPAQDQFYTSAPPVRHRAVSELSLCTSNTDLESPALTETSSPKSKTHSRSLTAESRMTPISPPSTVDESSEPASATKFGDSWPIVDHYPSQVGVAL